jgi:hypothetical protein
VNSIDTVTIQGDPASDSVAGELFSSDSSGNFSTSVMTKTGIYYVNATTSGTNVTAWYAKLAVTNPTMSLKLKSSGTEVSSITEGTNLTVGFTNNLNGSDMVSLVITDPSGNTKTKTTTPAQNFSLINVSYLASNYGGSGAAAINTTGWKLGTYTFKVATKQNTTAPGHGARGLSMESNEATLTLLKSAITIEAEKTSAVELGSIKLTVTGVSGHAITLNTSDTAHTTFPVGSNDNPNAAAASSFAHSIDADGKRTYTVKFDETGSYTIRVTDTTDDTYDTADIAIVERSITFDIPSTVTIGDKLTIKGTANTGSSVDIAVDGTVDALLNDLVIDENKEFSKEISTTDIAAFAVPGSVRLKAYIDRTGGAGVVPTTDTDDGSTAILMVRGGLTAELSMDIVAQDDDFTISGTAKGSNNVNVLIVSPKGKGGTYITTSAVNDIYNETASVSEVDDVFSRKISVGANVDTGSYLIVVLSPGSDSVYNGLTTGTGVTDFYTNLSAAYNLLAKTQEQLLAIIQDATVSAAGSDDLIWVGYIKVATPFVTLDPIVSVAIGEPLAITGTSNRKEGFAIVVTAKGPMELAPQTVNIEDGTFNATFDTAGATVGTYTVKADDGDGHTDEVTVSIVTEVAPAPTAAPTAEPTAKPTAAPAPTAAPTATPTAEPTPEPPGFEAVFAIAGLSYLVLRKRRE